MERTARHTLFWKYAAYLSGLVGVLLLLSGASSGYIAYRQSMSALEEIQRAKARFAATEIANFIGRLEDALQLATVKFSANGTFDAEYLRLELIALLRHQRSITGLHWIAPDGRERFALSRVVRDAPDSSKDWSADPLFAEAAAGRAPVGPVSFREGTEPYVSLARGRSRAGPVLIADVNLKFVGDVITKIRDGSAGIVYVVDAMGRLVAHPDSALVLGNSDFSGLPQVRHAIAAKAGVTAAPTQAYNAAGVSVLAAAAPIERLGWTVFAEQPREDAFRSVYASIATSIALALVGLAAAIVASLVLARHMVLPIRQLEAGAHAIGEGRLDLRIDVKSGDELEALAVRFNQMAARLADVHATQEARIAERTRALALANEAKTRFLAAASHDLRQPMHALSLFVGQLRSDARPEEMPALLGKIEDSVDALQDLLEGLLDLSKLDMGTVVAKPRAIRAQALLSRLVTQLAPAAEAKGLALTLVPTTLWIRSDPQLLERILLNVLSNAIRYTFEGRVLLGCRRHADSVDLVVADTGTGIDPAHLPYIFQEFYQAPRPHPSARGLGLGLAIVQRLALLLGHEIDVRSVPGRGTAFRVVVPRAAADAAHPQARGAAPTGLDGKRVLVVDDDDAVRVAITGLLARWGCEVASARNGDEALDRTREWPPQLVLCDFTLANGENGLHVADRLRRAHGNGLTCAFITGESTADIVAAVRARGYPVAFKPMKPGKLRAMVEQLLRE